MYFTTFSVFARRMEIVFVGFSIMFNHTHATALDETRQRLTLFQRQVGVSTAHSYNKEYGRKGPLQHHSFGFSVKNGVKRILGNIAYVVNNCVAGKMNRNAIENRWTLLAYYNNPHPFSEAIVNRERSRRMIRAMRLVDIKFGNDEYIDYLTQRRIFQSNAGNEFDLKDDCGDHSCYRTMIGVLSSYCKTTKIDVEKLDDNTLNYLKSVFSTQYGIKDSSINKFLHLPRSTQTTENQ